MKMITIASAVALLAGFDAAAQVPREYSLPQSGPVADILDNAAWIVRLTRCGQRTEAWGRDAHDAMIALLYAEVARIHPQESARSIPAAFLLGAFTMAKQMSGDEPAPAAAQCERLRGAPMLPALDAAQRRYAEDRQRAVGRGR